MARASLALLLNALCLLATGCVSTHRDRHVWIAQDRSLEGV
ncbi:MAG: hypothetical protein ACKO2G_15935 [Verrucomicrobiales bacterium]